MSPVASLPSVIVTPPTTAPVESVPLVTVPKLVNDDAVTPELSVEPVRVPAAAVTVIAAEPSKLTPLIARAVAKTVAAPAVSPEAVPVMFVPVIDDGVPPAPSNSTGAPAEPVLMAKAVAMPVPSPLTPVEIGNPVALVRVPDDGVPKAPPLTTNAPAEPVLTANAVATPVPNPEMPVETGNPVALVSVPLEGVPSAGVVKLGEIRLAFRSSAACKSVCAESVPVMLPQVPPPPPPEPFAAAVMRPYASTVMSAAV